MRWAGIIFEGDKYTVQHRLKKARGLITRSGISVVMMWQARTETMALCRPMLQSWFCHLLLL